jgi:hypothetical protein
MEFLRSTGTRVPWFHDRDASTEREHQYAVQGEDFHWNVSAPVALTSSTNLSASVSPGRGTSVVFDEDNFLSSGIRPTSSMCLYPGFFNPPPVPYPTNPDAPPPVPICTINLYFRKIATTGGSIAGHGYITFYSSYTHQKRIIEGYMDDQGYLRAQDSATGLPADDPTKDQGVGGLGRSTNFHTSCTYESKYLAPAIAKINAANVHYGYFGTNSNSV